MKFLLQQVVIAGFFSIHAVFSQTQAPTVDPKPTNLIEVCTGTADVILLLDRSGSVGDKDYPFLVDFANHLANTFNISKDGVRLGVASYSNTAKIEIQLSTYGITDFMEETSKMTRGSEQLTNIADGLKLAETMLEDKSNGARDGAVKLIIVTNDGQANRGDMPGPVAKRLHDKFHIVSIGISPTVAPPNKHLETQSLASKQRFYYYIPEYTSLADESFLQNVSRIACRIVTVVEPLVEDTEHSIYEDTAPGTPIHQIPRFGNEFNIPQYMLIPQANLPFSVATDGVITLTQSVDRETQDKYVFFVYITDLNVPDSKQRIQVTIHILDVNDNDPENEKYEYFVYVYEGTQYNPPTVIFQLNATDEDSGVNGQIEYFILRGNDANKFQLEQSTGKLLVVGEIDREERFSYSLYAVAKDKGTPKRTSKEIRINVIVIDLNDNPPVFVDNIIYLEYPENQALGNLYQLVATDKDSGINGVVGYRFDTPSGNDDSTFALNSGTGFISLLKSFNFETQRRYTLYVKAYDSGTPQQVSGKVTVHITVNNIDEALTIDGPHQKDVQENQAKNVPILKVTATDPEKSQITYMITEQSPFEIRPNGDIVLTGTIDRESSTFEYVLTITASAGSHTVSTTVTITVTDYNDEIPKFGQSVYYGNIDENSPKDTTVTTTNAVSATDSDATSPNNQFMFRITNGNTNDAFKIDPANGVVSVNTPSELNHESSKKQYSLTIEVFDKGSPELSSTAIFNIGVNNINDNPPSFSLPSYSKDLRENTLAPTLVVQVLATDADGDTLTYSIPPGLPFNIDSDGKITVSQPPNAETQSTYNFKVKVSDGKNTAQSDVVVNIIDINDVEPTFTSPTSNTFDVPENKDVGYEITTFEATDGDLTAPNNQFMIKILVGNEDGKFELASNGKLKLAEKLDFNAKKLYQLTVIVEDKGVDPAALSNLLSININVGNVNIHSPKFTFEPYIAEIKENEANPSVIKVTAVDNDLPADTLTFSIENSGPFEINPTSGEIKGTKIFDSEDQHSYTINVKVTDSAGQSSQATVSVTVLDLNDNKPQFKVGVNKLTVSESFQVDKTIQKYSASDNDRTAPNNQVMYMLLAAGNTGNAFKIDQNNGNLKLQTALDFETTETYTLTIRAQDKGTPAMSTDLVVTITVNNDNEHNPKFTPSTYSKDVLENKPSGFIVLTVAATDADKDSILTFSLPQGIPFDIKPNGDIVLKSLSPPDLPLDRETQAQYKFEVKVSDEGGLTDIAHVTVNVLDVNDNPPSFGQPSYTVYIREDKKVGTLVETLIATDPDANNNGMVTYEIIEGDKTKFSINSDGQIMLIDSVNFEENEQYVLKVQAKDKGNPAKSSVVLVTINIWDINEKPVFPNTELMVSVAENSGVGTPVITVKADDPDAGLNGTVNYVIQSGNEDNLFEIDLGSGKVTVKKDAINFEEKEMYILIIRANDLGNPSLDTSGADLKLTIKIDDINEKPTFDPKTASQTIPETSTNGAEVITVTATDPDKGNAGMLTYEIILGDPNKDFQIDDSGKITVKNQLDFNSKNKYQITVRATDKGNPPLHSGPDDIVVTIMLSDDNNHAPVFDPKNYTKTLAENAKPGDHVVQVFATDADSGSNGMIKYSIVAGLDSGTFDIDEMSGQVTLKNAVDFETQKVYQVRIHAVDKGTPTQESAIDALVVVDVSNENEHPPVITNLPYTAKVSEEMGNVEVYDVDATDPDDETITFSIQTDGPFAIDQSSGKVTTNAKLDRESRQTYIIKVTAHDGKYSDMKILTVMVTDKNDNKPEFVEKSYEKTIPEDTSLNTTVVTVEATDKDIGTNAKIMFMIVDGNDENKFDIFTKDDNTAVIVVAGNLDYITTNKYVLTVRASDKGDPMMDSAPMDATVTIHITDVNNNKPIFKPVQPILINENSDPKVLVTVIAEDDDSGSNGEVMYEIIDGNNDKKFEVNEITGQLSLVGKLDYETVKSYKLTIRATDKGTPAQTSEPNDLMVTINVDDYNDNPPKFTQKEYTVTIPETTPTGTPVVTVDASDADSGVNKMIMYSIKSGADGVFEIDNSGVIKLIGTLDAAVKNLYIITVIATDKGSPSMQGEALVRIHITDDNNMRPTFNPLVYPISIAEDSGHGTHITTVIATDGDIGSNGEIVYSIIGGDPDKKFEIHPILGNITLKKTVNFEEQDGYRLIVRATDKGDSPLHSDPDAHVLVILTDVNDNDPVFTKDNYMRSIPETTPVSTLILTVKATDLDSTTNGEVMYEIINNPGFTVFKINMTSGEITLEEPLDVTVTAQYDFIVRATDKGSPQRTGTATVTIKINDVNMPPVIQPQQPVDILDDKDVGYEVLAVIATDPDIGNNGELMYEITEGNTGQFGIDSEGKIKVISALTTASPIQVKLKVKVSDKGQPSLSDTEEFIINIIPSNHPPNITPGGPFTISENALEKAPVFTVVAADSDLGDNGVIMYEIIEGNIDNAFKIDMNSGAVIVNGKLDASKISTYTLKIKATDKGKIPLHDTKSFIVNIMAVNAPVFTNGPISVCVDENEKEGTHVTTAGATDVDGDTLWYSLQSSTSVPFEIDEQSGKITTTAVIDREMGDSYTFNVSVTDGTHTVTITVTVCINDKNDNPPIVIKTSIVLTVCENMPIGTPLTNVNATDLDTTSTLTYEIVNRTTYFSFRINGEGMIRVNGLLDFESEEQHQFKIKVSDGANILIIDVTINICNLNEYPPVFAPVDYTVEIMDGSGPNTPVVTVMATDMDSGVNGMFMYSFVSGYDEDIFIIDENTGSITLAKTVDLSVKSVYNLVVKAQDKGTKPSSMSSSPNAKVKVTIKPKKIVCKCTLNNATYPCLKWTKFEIIRKFEGKCFVDKLKEAIKHITMKINNINEMITQFNTCKLELRGELSSSSSPLTYAELFIRYDKCVLSIDCKLNFWKLQLEKKKMQLDKELIVEENGWGNFNVPGADYAKVLWGLMKNSHSSRSDW